MKMKHGFVGVWLLLAGVMDMAPMWAAEPPIARTEDDYYKLVTLPIPKEIVLEVGALDFLPDGRLAVGTRRGEIYFVSHALGDVEKNPPQFVRFASGLHEILGLAHRDGWLYVTQRPEVSRLKDTNNDGRADIFETVSDDWQIKGDYHEYAFSSPFDNEGRLWVVLCLTGSFTSEVKFRGWCGRVTPDGAFIPTCAGIRSPGGIGFNKAGDVFYTDNQGPWNGTCGLKHLVPGSFQGHTAGLRWYSEAPNLKPVPEEPKSGSRTHIEAKRVPEYMPAAVLFPYQKMGQSASGIACDQTNGAFGPFTNQLFVGDVTHSTVMRVYLEKVKGRYQGACFPFREQLASGTLALLFAPDGSLMVGETNRGWGSRGTKPYALQRIVWTKQVPFEVETMSARPDGFLLTFTQPVDEATVRDPKNYQLSTYTYILQSAYGSPEVDHTTPTIEQIEVTGDRRQARLVVKGLQEGHVHELHLDGVRNTEGRPLLHPVAYYTMNQIPSEETAAR